MKTKQVANEKNVYEGKQISMTDKYEFEISDLYINDGSSMKSIGTPKMMLTMKEAYTVNNNLCRGLCVPIDSRLSKMFGSNRNALRYIEKNIWYFNFKTRQK